jgi:hypothetical protein
MTRRAAVAVDRCVADRSSVRLIHRRPTRGVERPGPVPTNPECPMAGKNKRGREVRKPKQTPKPKQAKEGTDLSRVIRQAKLPRTK